MINSFHVGGGLDGGRDLFPRARGKDDLGWIIFRRAGNRRRGCTMQKKPCLRNQKRLLEGLSVRYSFFSHVTRYLVFTTYRGGTLADAPYSGGTFETT